MRARCWLSRAHWNTAAAGERRAAPCEILLADSVTGEWATQKRQLFQCEYIPVGAVPLILTWFSYIVQYVKCTYKGHTCTTQRRENICASSICASSVQYPAVKRTLNGLKNALEQSYLGKSRERNHFMIPLSIILFFYSKTQWIWLLLLVVSVVQACPKMQPLPWRSFLYQWRTCRIDLLNFCKVRHTGTEPINVRYSL